jgi:hypothetical protein
MTDSAEKPKEIKQVQVNLIPGGEPRMGRVYSNYAQISHSPWEFSIRFCLAPASIDITNLVPGETATVEIPIIIDVMVSPAVMPGLIKALQDNFERYEETFGKTHNPLPAGMESITH